MSALVESWTGVLLRSPWALALGVLVPLAFLLAGRRGAPAIRFGPGALLGLPRGRRVLDAPRLPGSWRTALLPLPAVLEVAGLLALVVALARPAVRVVAEDVRQGIDVVLALDVSSSMETADGAGARPRIEAARDAAAAFVRGRGGDRIGLLTFALYPDLRCPLTRDHAALLRILAEVRAVPAESAEDMTGIGTAVARSVEALEAAGSRSRVVVLLTDGEENVAPGAVPGEIPPLHAAQLAANLGVRVHAIVAGRGRVDRTGQVRPIDTRAVENLARKTGGGFFRAEDASALGGVFAQVDALDRSPFVEPRYGFEDLHLPFLVLGLLLLLAGRTLRSTALQVLP